MAFDIKMVQNVLGVQCTRCSYHHHIARSAIKSNFIYFHVMGLNVGRNTYECREIRRNAKARHS